MSRRRFAKMFWFYVACQALAILWALTAVFLGASIEWRVIPPYGLSFLGSFAAVIALVTL